MPSQNIEIVEETTNTGHKVFIKTYWELPEETIRLFRGLKNKIETYRDEDGQIFYGKRSNKYVIISYFTGEVTEKIFEYPDDLVNEVIRKTNEIRVYFGLCGLNDDELIGLRIDLEKIMKNEEDSSRSIINPFASYHSILEYY